MNRKRTALTVAAAGTTAGVVGLVLLAVPAGAGTAPPQLPPTTAQDLVQSVLTTTIPAMSGTVEVHDNIGLPFSLTQLAGVGSSSDGIRVYTDGQGKARISLAQQAAEKTIVEDGTTTWVWNSADKSVRKIAHGSADSKTADGQMSDPATASKTLVDFMRKDSTVTVDGTASVAGRPAYQLVLTPNPTEKTLLREVRVAVDSQTRVPLRLQVMANGQADPALEIGFSQFSPGAQDPSLFQFTVPQGAKVTEGTAGPADKQQAQGLLSAADPKFVGEGWDTVVVAKLPAGLLDGNSSGNKAGKAGLDPTALLQRFAKPVSGAYGSGWEISTKVATVLLTADGRVAAGAVPEQVLVDALGQVK